MNSPTEGEGGVEPNRDSGGKRNGTPHSLSDKIRYLERLDEGQTSGDQDAALIRELDVETAQIEQRLRIGTKFARTRARTFVAKRWHDQGDRFT